MNRFAEILKKLPTPHGVYTSPSATFEVYRAKDMYSHRWNDPALRELVAMGRASYSRYGKRPLFDAYDAKAAIYLTRVVYEKRTRRAAQPIEEWLTLRMVPGDTAPLGVSEPEIYVHAGKRIDYWMKRKIGRQGFWNHVASSSRMCGIHPYTVSQNGIVDFLADDHHRYTPICFALMHKQFILDYPLAKYPYRYITGMIRDDFYKKGLSYSPTTSGTRAVRPAFMPAYKFLGFKSGDVEVQRHKYSYDFPLYWFDMKKLIDLVNRLRQSEHKDALSRLEPAMFSGLASKNRRPVTIAGIRIEPGKMRKLIDQNVPDAPELKITKAEPWYRSMAAILRAAKVTPEKKSAAG